MLQQLFDNPRLHMPAIIVLCLLLFFPLLAARDFWELENQYAEVIRVMLLDGNYLLPTVNDSFFPESPPLFFWLATGFSWLMGGASEWSIRLPSALSATELVVLSYYFLRKRFSARLAFLSAVVLTTSVLTVHVERHVQINMLFYLFITGAMFLLIEVLVFASKRPIHAYGAWLAMALACLTNGPMGFFFPLAVVFLYLAITRRWETFTSLRPMTGALLSLLVTIPWFIFLANTGPSEWLDSILVHLHFTGHRGPDHQVFFSFPLAFSPWCFLVVPLVICLWRQKSRICEGPILFFFLWFVVGLFLSEVSFGRHNHYLFLTYVPFAVGIAVYLECLDLTDPADAVRRWTWYSVVFLCSLFLLGGISLPVISRHLWPLLATSVTALSSTLLALTIGVYFAWRRWNSYGLVIGFAAYPLVAILILQTFLFPALNAVNVRPLAEKLKAALSDRAGGLVGIYSRRRFPDFNYYSQIRKFEMLRQPAEVASFVQKQGAQFILARFRHVEEVKNASETELTVVIDDTMGFEHWVLLSACGEGCRSSSVAPKSAARSLPAQTMREGATR